MKYLFPVSASVALAAFVAGCASAPSHFYTLDPVAKADGTQALDCAVFVGPIFIPYATDRPQIMLVTAPNRVEFDEFNRWAAPLNDSIGRVVSQDIATLLGTVRVATGPMPEFGPGYRVTIRIEEFETRRGQSKGNGEASLEALWAVRGPAGDNLGSGRTSAKESAPGGSYEALAAAHSRALAKLSSDIAATIRKAAAEK
jgi:uncharacterized lipoprotein YmbA